MAEAYPRHREADVVVADGGTVHLRPIVPSDAGALVAMHARTSERTRYLRFFGPYPRIPDRDLHRFTHVDHVWREAFVVLLGEDLVAVGRYEGRPGEPSAEVAFLVEDAHQGRGLGPVLLEHLAAAGRESGVRRFEAEVLPENHRMARVFLDAGYEPARSYEDGVLHLAFAIEPTASSTAVAYERAERAEARSLARLLTPGPVAVVGASGTPGKVGHVVLRNLLAARGRLDGRAADAGPPVYPVRPSGEPVLGVPAYRSVTEIPGDVDLAVLAVPADQVAGVVEECGHKGVRGLVVVSGGYGEREGAAGRRAERELVESARRHGMRVVGPNALGVLNADPAVRLNATLAPAPPPAGRLGFFCQSGALGVAILADARDRGLGMSTFVSAGNRADVSGNDLLQYWTSDPATDAVLLYLESFGNPRKFARLARRLARTKPVVAVKSGRHAAKPELARRAAPMSEESVEALFRSTGTIRVATIAELFDVAQVLAYQPLPAGTRVGVVGNSSALSVLVADACLAEGLVPVGAWSRDIGPEGTPEAFAAELTAVFETDEVDAVVAVFVPPLSLRDDDYAAALAEVSCRYDRPVVSTFLGLGGVPEPLRRRDAGGEIVRGSVPSYPSPERAVRALALTARYADWRRRPVGRIPELAGIAPPDARALVDGVLAAAPEGRPLTADETAALLAAYGVPVAASAPAEVTAGVEVEVTVTDDPSFGALVGFGLAGVASDLLGDRAYRTLPLTDVDAADLVAEPRAAPLLSGYGGRAPVDAGALTDLVLRVARLADDLAELLALRLVAVAGPGGVRVTTASARIGPPTARVAPGPRRLAPAG